MPPADKEATFEAEAPEKGPETEILRGIEGDPGTDPETGRGIQEIEIIKRDLPEITTEEIADRQETEGTEL